MNENTSAPSVQEKPVLWWVPDVLPLDRLSEECESGAAHPLLRPFRAGRSWGDIASNWDETWRHAQLKTSLDENLGQSRSLVHVYSDGGRAFQWALLSAASRLGYQHRVLCWSNRLQALRAVARLLDWPEKERRLHHLLKIEEASFQNLAYIRRLMQVGHHEWNLISVDDFPCQGDFHGLPSSLARGFRELLISATSPLGLTQEDALGREIAWRAGVQQMPCFLRPKVVAPDKPDPRIKLVRLDGLPPWVCSEDRVSPGGVVVFDSDVPAQLTLDQGEASTSLDWPRPSPGVASKWPGIPAAKAARFRAAPMRADDHQPAHLALSLSDGSTIPVADVQFNPHPRSKVSGIFLAPWSVGYQPIPKVACTSIKEALFRLVMKEPFSQAVGGGAMHIHSYFDQREQDVTQADWRFLVIRDPIQRFLSGYSNRVLHHRELSRDYIARLASGLGLSMDDFPFDPSLDEFVENFDFYCRVPTIRHHFQPISEFVAPLSAFNRVYAFEELSALAEDLSNRTRQDFSIPHSQRGGPKLRKEQIGPSAMKRLVDIYSGDYEMLRDYYLPPSLSTAGK